MNKRLIRSLCVTVALSGCLWGSSNAYCYDDGFGAAKSEKGKHFTLFYAPAINPVDLAMRLDVNNPGIRVEGETGGSSLSGMLDVLFARVCDILDMQLYSYEGNIKVCRDAGQLNSIYQGMFGKALSVPSFYVNELNTIYVDQEHFTQWIIGHEMSHAIQCHYFVVSPPAKISEVLAGYVEYELRKK
jgi:hypothetical protein